MFGSDLRLGYYTYKDKCFFNREQVYDEMLLHNDFDSKLEYEFNPDIFDKINWYKDINIGILDLYKARAIQIRQTYENVILMFSGGSDSMQILYTFLKNNIKIDEIRIFSFDKMVQAYGEDKILLGHPGMRIHLEYKIAALKTIEQIKHLIPDTVINHVDMSDDMVTEMSSKQQNFLIRPGYIGIGAYSYQPRFFTSSANRYNIKHHKENSCLIYGVEKPIIKFDMKTQMLRFHFSDAVMRDYAYAKSFGFSGLNIETFYWTKDFPYIPIKQAQLIRNYLIDEPEGRNKFYRLNYKISQEKDFKIKRDLGTDLARMFDSLIYPNWMADTFVAPKPRKFRHEFFLYEQVFGKTYSDEIYDEAIDYRHKKYDKIKNRMFSGYVLSKPYSLGKIPLPVI